MSIRLATYNDIPSIVDIYNEYIDTTITMDTEQATIESRTQWFQNHSTVHPVTCYVSESGEILGWASLSKWSEKMGYRYSVENSIYVSKKCHRGGIGTKLLEDLIQRAKELQYHCIISRIDSENLISLALHQKYGFKVIGEMKETGFKFNKYINVKILQLLLQ